jgi:DNA modification methylase
VPTRLLHCNPELSAGDGDAGNLFVQADNLEALKALLPFYAGKVKCIYIDPPYNTGNEKWVYNDNVNSPEIRSWLKEVVGKEAEDLSRHDKWLCMIYPRLRLLRDFLSDDGALFVSCDGNELHHLILVAKEATGFSEATVISVVNNMKGRNDKANLAQCHEYLVLLSGPNFAAAGLPLTEQQRKTFKEADEKGERFAWRDLRKRGGFDTREARPNLHYPIFRLPDGTLTLDEPPGELVVDKILPFKSDGVEGCWRWGPKRTRQYLSWLEATFVRKSGRWNVNYRVYLNPDLQPAEDEDSEDDDYDDASDEPIERTTKPKSFWWGPELSTDRAGKYLKDLLGRKAFDYPKPVDLIWRVVTMAGGNHCLVLDSFAGSGTTAEAVLRANNDDGQKRRFLLVEIDRDIAKDVTVPRLRIVSERYGSGFRYCTLGRPLFDEWGSITEGVTFGDLAAFVFFSDTGSPIPARADGATPLLGTFQDRAIYLLFKPETAGVGVVSAGNVLTVDVMESLPGAGVSGPRVVYGEGCTVPAERLAAAGVVFKQVPYHLMGT